MGKSLNMVQLIGNVGSDPESRRGGSGVLVVKISLATNRTTTDRTGNKRDVPSWHRVTFFEKLAEIVHEHIHVGDRLYIRGRIEYSQYEKDGQTHYATEIVADDVVMLGGKGKAVAAEAGAAQGGGTPASPFDADDDDLPF